ncbi:MAG: ribosome recycling factor [Candidatus Pacebacteria bacterium]|nr:ribosome recycling factor [Candidatus Paceibacterota bacterium]
MYNFTPFKQKLEKIIEHAKKDIATLRTGRASVDMLDPVKVQAYGSSMGINELANIGTPDPNLILIKPWDQNLIENIEEAIHKSDLNLNPVVDKDQIRIVVPALTEERRQEMVKKLNQKIESAKVMMRNARTEVKNEIDELEGQAGVSEDDIHRDLEQLDKIVKEYTQKLEQIETDKEKELTTI